MMTSLIGEHKMGRAYGAELAKQIEAQKQRFIEQIDCRNKRIADGLTDMDDCFISQRFEENGIHECNLQLAILDGDGFMTIEQAFNEKGEPVTIGSFANQWGGTTYISTKADGTKVFASSKKALIKKAGFSTRLVLVPCWTRFVANGSGMLGAYSGSIQVCRWHTNMVTGEEFGFDGFKEIEG